MYVVGYYKKASSYQPAKCLEGKKKNKIVKLLQLYLTSVVVCRSDNGSGLKIVLFCMLRHGVHCISFVHHE